eukprot:3447370-Amphidinium_carterae.2
MSRRNSRHPMVDGVKNLLWSCHGHPSQQWAQRGKCGLLVAPFAACALPTSSKGKTTKHTLHTQE